MHSIILLKSSKFIMAAISVKKSISESMSACLLGGCGGKDGHYIRYKMLELLVYKHVIVHL